MAITFPITLYSGVTPRRVRIKKKSTVGVSKSPFTGEQQIYVHQGETWEMSVDYPPLERADAEELIGSLLQLNGREGTFQMGDPVGATPRGTWNGGSPVLSGAHALGVKTLTIRGVDGLTWKSGDWLQIGTYLHKVTLSGQQSGSPSVGTVEIWPRTRAAYSDGQALVVASAKGLWRLSSNDQAWDIETAQLYGISFECEEAL